MGKSLRNVLDLFLVGISFHIELDALLDKSEGDIILIQLLFAELFITLNINYEINIIFRVLGPAGGPHVWTILGLVNATLNVSLGLIFSPYHLPPNF